MITFGAKSTKSEPIRIAFASTRTSGVVVVAVVGSGKRLQA